MLRILLVSDTGTPTCERDALACLGHEMLAEVATPQTLLIVAERERPDVVIIDTESPSSDTLEQLAVMHEAAPRPVLLFSRDAHQDSIRAAVDAGVTAYVADELTPDRLAPTLELALARFTYEQNLRQRLADAECELDERKTIDQAKRILMERCKLSEHEAYVTLRKRSMDASERIVEIARQVIDMAR
jgi:two-component system, response regulator / RNA-binding antiterminator